MMDPNEIDSALHEISCMVEFAHRLMSETIADEAGIFHIPYDDLNLLDSAINDIARRVKASRAIVSEADGPATIKPVLSIVRDPA
jgi:hypothetical protein